MIMADVRLKYVRLADNVSLKMGKLEPREYFRIFDKVRMTLVEEQNRIVFEFGDDKKSVHESQVKHVEYFTPAELDAVLAAEQKERKERNVDAKKAVTSP